MTLKELLEIMAQVAKVKNLNTPYIVGGVPRNIVLGKLDEIKDVDITTGSPDVETLALGFADSLGMELKTIGHHKTLNYGGISFDFSHNFVYPEIDKLFAKNNLSGMSSMDRETYSRDFTTNTLMLDLSMKTIVDLTGKGYSDTQRKVLDCPLDCAVSFVHDPKRMLRAFHFKASYGYTFSKALKEALLAHASLLSTVNSKYASQITNTIFRNNEAVIDEMIEMGLFKHLPLSKELTEILLRKHKILDVL